MTETPFNQEEFDKYLAAVKQLNNNKLIALNISERAAFLIIAQLQLAFRHPANNGSGRDVVRQTIQPIVEYFTGDARAIIERGFHPEFDVKPQPDPAWSYYEIHSGLTTLNNKITEALKLISNQENASLETDNKLLEILKPHAGDLFDIVADLKNYR